MKALRILVTRIPCIRIVPTAASQKSMTNSCLFVKKAASKSTKAILPKTSWFTENGKWAEKNCGYIEPYAPCPSGYVGWMSGGSFAGSSDGRFFDMVGIYGAVPVHDRAESQKQYEATFR